MEEYPPIDFMAAAWMKGQEPKPIREQIDSVGFPHKKGKVIKRGDIGR